MTTAIDRGERWYHTIALPDGTLTAGVFDTRSAAKLVPWPERIRGGRCLDIGTCDGFWAFEMERRGAAEVMAIDVDDPSQLDLPAEIHMREREVLTASAARRRKQFDAARQALNSKVTRCACSVYDLDPSVHGRFDVVFCGSLLVHLRDPVRAFVRMREVCEGELVLVEALDATLDIAARWIPCARSVPVSGQWWRYNAAGLRRALEAAGFEVVQMSRRFVTPPGPQVATRNFSEPRARMQAVLSRIFLAYPSAPFLAQLFGLWRGTYDIAIRARPRSFVTSSSMA